MLCKGKMCIRDRDKMDRILEQNLLYDFYGELLTEHQQRVYEDAVYNDMSLSLSLIHI